MKKSRIRNVDRRRLKRARRDGRYWAEIGKRFLMIDANKIGASTWYIDLGVWHAPGTPADPDLPSWTPKALK